MYTTALKYTLTMNKGYIKYIYIYIDCLFVVQTNKNILSSTILNDIIIQ